MDPNKLAILILEESDRYPVTGKQGYCKAIFLELTLKLIAEDCIIQSAIKEAHFKIQLSTIEE
jgi:hypothetical protein